MKNQCNKIPRPSLLFGLSNKRELRIFFDNVILYVYQYVLAEGHAAGLVDELLVVEDGLVPGHVEVEQYLLHPLAGVKNELLVGYHEAALGPDVLALLVHHRDRLVPLDHALPVRGQVEARYRHLPGHLPEVRDGF